MTKVTQLYDIWIDMGELRSCVEEAVCEEQMAELGFIAQEEWRSKPYLPLSFS